MRSAANGWEADPWDASDAVADAQLAGFWARATKPIEWNPVRGAGSLVFGIMRVVNLAHGIIVIAGAYFAIVITRQVPVDPLLTFLVVGPVIFLIAALTQRLLLQRLLGQSLEAPLVATLASAALTAWSWTRISMQ